jgi:hypothetical protein
VGSLDVTRPDEESLHALGPPADVILFADLIYIDELAAALPKALARLLHRAPDKSRACCFGCVAERTSVGGAGKVTTFQRGLHAVGLECTRIALPRTITAGAGFYEADDEYPHLYSIRLTST